MVKRWIVPIRSYFETRIIPPDAPADAQLGLRLFIWISLLIFPIGVLGVIIGSLGSSPVMVAIAALCAVFFPLNAILLLRTGRNDLHVLFWALGILIVMLAWGILLGGYRLNFGVYWAAFIPLVLIVLLARRQGDLLRWYLIFTLFTIAFSLLDPYVENPANAPTNVDFANTFTVLSSGGLTLLAFQYYKREKNTALRLLDLERERADGLLLNILPHPIAEILKVEERTIADHYESASILFADLVGFTPLSARMKPVEMIDLLNTVYSHFDGLAERYGVEKIRTIGDGYMAAAGVPEPRPDHARAVAHMALDMQAFIEAFRTPEGERIGLRIGLNSGPLVAGVIGQKKFHYDVWGDTVNTASRMESHGEAGMIQITAAMQALLHDEFDCRVRGVIDVKGKGPMETWQLVGRRRTA